MALNLGEISAHLTADTKDFNRGLQQASNAAKKWESQTVSASKAVARTVAVGMAAVGASIIGAAAAGLKMAADMETTATSMKVFLGSADAAKKMMDDLRQFATETPFEFPEIAQSAKQLLALGMSAKDIIPSMKMLGDVASGSGIPLNDLARIYGRILQSNEAYMDDLNQLADRGVPIMGMLAKQYGITIAEVKKLASEGKISGDAVKLAFQQMTSEGGLFKGMMSEQSKTVNGLMSTLKDGLGNILVNLGAQLITTFDLQKKMEAAIKWVDEFGKTLDTFSKTVTEGGIGKALDELIPDALEASILGVSTALMVSMVPALIASTKAAYAASVAFLAANGSMLVMVVGVGLVVAAAWLLYKNWDEVTAKVREVINNLTAFFQKWPSEILGALMGPLGAVIGNVMEIWNSLDAETRAKWTKMAVEAYELGSQFVQGLLNGIRSAGNEVINYANELATSVSNVFNRIWQIRSPSKVAKKQGEDYVKGLIKGFEKMHRPAVLTAKDLAEDITDVYQDFGTDSFTDIADSAKAMTKSFTRSAAEIEADLDKIVIGAEKVAATLDQLEKPRALTLVMNTLQNMGGVAGDTASSFLKLGTDWGNMQAGFAEGGVSGILTGISMIPSVIKGVKEFWGKLTGSTAKKKFRSDIKKQSEANKAAALEELQAYKDYAAAIRAFGKESLVSIMGLANTTTQFLEGMDLDATGTRVKKKVKTFFGLGSSTARTTLWTYTFDKIGAESAKAWLDRFMQIASGLSSSVGSAFSEGIKGFLSGKTDWIKTLKDGIKDAIIDAITTAVLQATIIKGALGNLLGQLATGLTAGEDVSGVIGAIGAAIPALAAQLQAVLTPLRGAIMNAFPGGVDPHQLPQMAKGGVVTRPTMAVIGEAGPEVVFPLSKLGRMSGLGGGAQTIIIQLDGRTIAQNTVKHMPNILRVKTGVAL